MHPPAQAATKTVGPSRADVNPGQVPKPAGTPLRQRFTEYLILQQKAPRTVEAYVAWVRNFAAFHHKSSDLATHEDMDHPHLHCLVTGGGLVSGSDLPRWRGPEQTRYLFPVQAVAAMFRGKFLEGLRHLYRDKALEFLPRCTSCRRGSPRSATSGCWGTTNGRRLCR